MDLYNLPKASILGKGIEKTGSEKSYTYTYKIHNTHATHKKWSKTDDTIFEDLSMQVISEEQKEKIADLLNLFYYFIICYSKTCFKKYANWDSKYKYNHHNKSNKLYLAGNTFDYKTANALNSHSKLLEMQMRLYYYRKQYQEGATFRNNYWTKHKINEIMDFIDKSLGQMVNFISVPLKLISPDITEKINKYKYMEAKIQKPSALINYDVAKALLGENWQTYLFLPSTSSIPSVPTIPEEVVKSNITEQLN
jgi:hypothetical protein